MRELDVDRCPDCQGTGSLPIPGDDGYPRRCYHHNAPAVADDIVRRLRCLPVDCDGTCYTCTAADEIERLRAELDAEGNDVNLLMLEIERLCAERDTERALADQLADALRWQADPYQKGTLMMSHRALDAYERIRRG